MPKSKKTAKRDISSVPLIREKTKKVRVSSSKRSAGRYDNTSSVNVLDFNRNKTRFNPTGSHSSELIRLQDHYMPGFLQFRDAEKSRIKDFIEVGLKTKGSTVALYITGLPGLGKTASVLETVKKLKQDKFDLYYINALKLRSAGMFYSRFWHELTGKDENPPVACKNMDKFFRNGDVSEKYSDDPYAMKRLRHIKLLIIDEIDYLKNKKQDVLYNIFEWQQQHYSKLIIICIANTLNFYSVLMPKIQSRMGNNVLVFKPYQSTEIEGILKSRLGNSTIFKPETIVFIAKKVANFSSDIRKSLHVARKALQLFLNDPNGKSQIDIEFVHNVFEEESLKPVVVFIQNSSNLMKMVLLALVYEANAANNQVFEFDQVFSRVNNILTQSGQLKLEFSAFKSVMERLREMRICKINYDASIRPKINFIADLDDICFALREDPVFNKLNFLRTIYEK